MEEEVRRLNRAYAALCACHGHLVRALSEDDLLEALCRTLVDLGGYRMAWVGYPEPGERGVRVAAHAGADNGYLESIRINWADDEFGQGPTGVAIRTGAPSINRDSRTNPSYAPWRERALSHGFQSSIALPLSSGEKVLGALCVYAAQPDAFDTDEFALLRRFADDLAFGIVALRTRRELEAKEAELRQAHKMEAVGRLAGGVAHDFNNMLSVILSYTNYVSERLPTDDPNRQALEEVHKAGLRATALTRRLLAFSRQQVLQPRLLDLNRVIAGLEQMLARLLGADITLSLFTEATGHVYLDAGQIEQVIVNLAVNARDAMPHGGTLTIETSDVELEAHQLTDATAKPGPYVALTVSDTGTGMDRETMGRIFEPFFTTKDVSKGTGLGLSTVYGIAQQSGGHIRVWSEVGKGARFDVYFPRAGSFEQPATSHSPTPVASRGTETILLVEDDEQVRGVMRTILRRQGYLVLEAQNGGDAFLLCDQHGAEIHLLVTDMVLPRMSGRQLAERLRERRPGLKVLYVSGYMEAGLRRPGLLDASGFAFLAKPITPDALAAKVREVLDMSGHGSALGSVELGATANRESSPGPEA